MKRKTYKTKREFLEAVTKAMNEAINEGCDLLKTIGNLPDEEVLTFIITMTEQQRDWLRLLIEMRSQEPTLDEHANQLPYRD